MTAITVKETLTLLKKYLTTNKTNKMNTNKFNDLEEKYLRQVLGLEFKSATNGNFTYDLEQRASSVLGMKYAIAQNSGTSTLHSALLALGVGIGDEVISPAFTSEYEVYCFP